MVKGKVMRRALDGKPVNLRKVGPEQANVVDCVLDQLTHYSRLVDGVPKAKDAALETISGRPPETDLAQKHLWVVLWSGRAIGLLDLIEGYPSPTTGFVGLLAIIEPLQRRGLGQLVSHALDEEARALGLTRLRLAVVDTNPVEDFWAKMGFKRTGEIRPHIGERTQSTMFLMEKAL